LTLTVYEQSRFRSDIYYTSYIILSQCVCVVKHVNTTDMGQKWS